MIATDADLVFSRNGERGEADPTCTRDGTTPWAVNGCAGMGASIVVITG
jgi:hypothetical protein